MLAQHPHDVTLPTFSGPKEKTSVLDDSAPKDIAQKWLKEFATVLSSDNITCIASLMHSDSWWRDFLTLQWDYRTIRGSQNIVSFLSQNASVRISNLELYKSGKFAPHFETPIEGLVWVESMFMYETGMGVGKGMIRLAQDEDGVWKAHFISTSLQELKDVTEAAGAKRPHGGNISFAGGTLKENWLERRERQKEFVDEDPTVLVIGAGEYDQVPFVAT
jgi:hypothetical protein